MGWDSNPRCPCRHAGFQDRCLKPLGHPSKPLLKQVFLDPFGRAKRVICYSFGTRSLRRACLWLRVALRQQRRRSPPACSASGDRKSTLIAMREYPMALLLGEIVRRPNGPPSGDQVINPLRSAEDDLQFQGHLMIDDKVRIKCTKCSQVFRERAQKVRPNFQTNCAHCNRLITFEFGSEDPNIRRALSSAKEIRIVVEAELKARANAVSRRT